MEYKPQLKSIAKMSDDELLQRLSELLQKSRRVESELIAHIGEVDARRLYAREASSSMFVYCTKILHLSEHEAYLRIEVARASRKHPILLEMLADGRLHMSGIAILHRHLAEGNREMLLERATYKSKQQIKELVAELSPQPDAPATMRKLPERRTTTHLRPLSQLGPDRVPRLNSEGGQAKPEVEPAAANPSASELARPGVVEPIAPTRYKVQFTASKELHDKLERLRALMRSSVPDGDLAAIIEEAVTEKLERLESKRFGKTKAPRKSLEETETSRSSRYIPAAVRRAVYDRDQGQCTFVDAKGRRCAERHRLEFHHRKPYRRGGNRRPENLELRCRTHNLYQAERDYGKEVMQRYRKQGSTPSRVSEPAAIYTFGNRATRAAEPSWH